MLPVRTLGKPGHVASQDLNLRHPRAKKPGKEGIHLASLIPENDENGEVFSLCVLIFLCGSKSFLFESIQLKDQVALDLCAFNT